MTENTYLTALEGETGKTWSLADILAVWRAVGCVGSDATLTHRVIRMAKRGELVRVAHNQYRLASATALRPYEPAVSDLARQVGEEVARRFPRLRFALFELKWLNDFLNHQLGRNVVLLMAGADELGLLFEELQPTFQGRILLNPSVEDFFRYWSQDLVVMVRLPTQSPKPRGPLHLAAPEQWLVDIEAVPLLAQTFEEAELKTLKADFRSRFVLNEAAYRRYAGRRGVKKR